MVGMLLIVFFTAFYAFAIGRSIFFWAFLSAFYGFWIPLLMVYLCQSENQCGCIPAMVYGLGRP
jgi:hypothetical protein